ncbi:MAG TPA: hypothetical protein VFV33_12730, partial [Gemmatimonadaceae bacterium]|nr:hypothetical protein [Gemmatimonadaceae bacterium]
LDPAVVVTLGRFSMSTFIPGVRIGQAHGTTHPVDPATGAPNALAFAMYHPAAALRSPNVERDSFEDIAKVPGVLLRARALRDGSASAGTAAPGEATMAAHHEPAEPDTAPAQAEPAPSSDTTRALAAADQAPDESPQLTLF